MVQESLIISDYPLIVYEKNDYLYYIKNIV